MKKKGLLSAILTLLMLSANAQDFKPLFNGKDLSGWYSYFNSKGKNNDVNKVFSVQNGMLYITGQEFGYIATEKIYSDFHLVVEFKWGTNKWPPREKAVRDNGLLYHMIVDKDHVWPRAFECQIQEKDCGDFWLIDSVTAIIDGVRTPATKNTHIVKKKDAEKPTGEWNRIEVISLKGKCTHIVNGVIVNEAEDASVRSGKIAIQSEGADIYYRRIDLKVL